MGSLNTHISYLNTKNIHMKKILILIILSAVAFQGFSQKRPARERIESARIALITDRLQLSPEQAQQFWPIYNEFTEKRRELGREYEEKRKNMNRETATEDEKRELLDLGLQTKEKVLVLEKEYSDKLLEVISVEQIMELRRAEEDFRRMLLEQLQKRQQRRRNGLGGDGR